MSAPPLLAIDTPHVVIHTGQAPPLPAIAPPPPESTPLSQARPHPLSYSPAPSFSPAPLSYNPLATLLFQMKSQPISAPTLLKL